MYCTFMFPLFLYVDMATDHKLLVFWASWIQLLVQHDFSVSFLILHCWSSVRKCAHKYTFTQFHIVFVLHNGCLARVQLCCRSSEFMPLTEQISLLSNAGGRLLPWSNGRFCLYVPVRWCSYDCILQHPSL